MLGENLIKLNIEYALIVNISIFIRTLSLLKKKKSIKVLTLTCRTFKNVYLPNLWQFKDQYSQYNL